MLNHNHRYAAEEKHFRHVFIWILISLISFTLIPAIASAEYISLLKKEPYFGLPVMSPRNILSIRNDAYGKGYFAASRNGGRRHKGVDFTAPVGQPIQAAKTGRVTFAGEDNGYGKYVEIGHPDGLITLYAHLSELNVSTGEWVYRGQMIGRCGKTGNAGEPRMIAHLHFEIRYKGLALNPTNNELDPNIIIY